MTGLSIDIRKRFGAFVLDANWSVGNEVTVLFGCSGAGKSLTLQAIAGLERPDAGHVRLNGRTLFDSELGTDIAPRDRSFGYVFQDLALFPHMTVRENILAGAPGMTRTERERRADEMIDRFGLAGLGRSMPARISGGQKQRVALARALIRRPEALLLDEPFSGLDAPLRKEMQRFLREVQREFLIPVVLVTHDLQEARSVGNRAVVYANGRVVRSGSIDDTLGDPGSAGVADIFGNSSSGNRTAAAHGARTPDCTGPPLNAFSRLIPS